jgi:hypothetical protein
MCQLKVVKNNSEFFDCIAFGWGSFVFNYEGIYKELTPIDKLDFSALLKSDFERKLAEQFIFKFELTLIEIKKEIMEENSQSLHVRVNIAKLIRFLTELGALFSKYYSKIHILEVCSIFVLIGSWYFRILLFNKPFLHFRTQNLLIFIKQWTPGFTHYS